MFVFHLLSSEFFSAGESKVGMRGLFHHEACEGDGVLHGGEAGNGAASPAGTIHDAGLHLHRPVLGECRSTARIEQGIRFQFPYLHTYKNKIHHKEKILINL